MRRTLIITRARTLRKSMSEPEVMLWSRLKGRDPGRPRFRRQHPFGNFILDFFCPAARLAVEVDGSPHWSEAAFAKDEARDCWLLSRGVVIHRIPASWIYRDLTSVTYGVVEHALALIAARRLAPSTIGSALRSADGPPPAAPRGGSDLLTPSAIASTDR